MLTEPRHIVIRQDSQRRRVCEAIGVDIDPQEGFTAAALPEGWEVIIRPCKTKRSLDQNACMWAINTAAGEERGYSKGEFHEIAKQRYQPYKRVRYDWLSKETGEMMHDYITVPWSTTDFGVKEMSAYIDWLAAFATEHARIDARRIRRSYRCE